MIKIDQDKLDNTTANIQGEDVTNFNRGIAALASEFIYASEKNDKIIELIRCV